MEFTEIIGVIIFVVVGISALGIDKRISQKRKPAEEPLDKQGASDKALQEAISRRAEQDFDWPILGGITLPMDVNSFLEAYRKFARQTGLRLSFVNERGSVEDYQVNEYHQTYNGKVYKLQVIMPNGRFAVVQSMFINKYGPARNNFWMFKNTSIEVRYDRERGVAIIYTDLVSENSIKEEQERQRREREAQRQAEERRRREAEAARIKDRYRRADETEKLL